MSLARPKPQREQDRAYRAWIGSLPCIACACEGRSSERSERSDCAHVSFLGSRGLGSKVSDRLTAPLCRSHHDEQHAGNERLFWARLGVDARRLTGLLADAYPDEALGRGVIASFAQESHRTPRLVAASVLSDRTAAPPAAAPVGELREEDRDWLTVMARNQISVIGKERSERIIAALSDASTASAILAAAPVTGDRETAGVEREELADKLTALAERIMCEKRVATPEGPGYRAVIYAHEVGGLLHKAAGVFSEDAARATPPSGGGDHAGGEASDRDVGGRIVREAWVRWALTQPNPKPTWLVPYNELSEPDKEADRQIYEACRATAAPESGVDREAVEAAERVKRFVRECYPADGTHKYVGTTSISVDDVALLANATLAASPKAQGSDVGLREALRALQMRAAYKDHILALSSEFGDEIVPKHLFDGLHDEARRVERAEAKAMISIEAALAASRTGQKGAGE